MRTKKLRLYYWIIGTLCLGFLAVGSGFTVFTVRDGEEKNISYFQSNAKSMKNNFTNLIESNMEVLDGVALAIGEMEVTDLEHLRPIIRQINDRNAFLRMGFVDPDGVGNLVDLDGTTHENMDFSEEDFFLEAKTGNKAVSGTKEDAYSGGYVNYYGVPVMSQGEIVGVLAAADNTDRLRMILDPQLFSNGGYASIIDSSGKYVIRSIGADKADDIREIGDFSAGELENIRKDLEAGTENLIEFEKDGERMLAYYLPVGINDWYLIGAVTQRMLRQDYYLSGGLVLLVVSAMGIFTFLVYCFNRIQMRSERELEVLAYSDPLLKIDNFVKFSMDIQTVLEDKDFRKIAFWYCDIDDFKFFNEYFGYETGDLLLKEMAEIFAKYALKRELFCRETSDHFAGIRCYERQSDLAEWYEKLTDELEHIPLVDQRSFRLAISVGFYCAEKPEDILSVNEMYNRAKMAHKSIKQQKNVKYAFYTDQLRTQLLLENEIEANMKVALKEGRFQVYFQPKAALDDENRISGGEALVRWQDPQKGFISPDKFIPLFERNGFIVSLDRYMFEQVCVWLQTYLHAEKRPIRIAVNVSRLGIFQDDFVEYYAGVKQSYGIPDGMLELEFTESLAIDSNELLRSRILELRERGFICSLDDFGAGYSSLNTLKDLPIQVLKLDMLFFKKGNDDEKARIIIENVIRMAGQLDIRVVAEGVERPEQVEFLKRCNCDVIQGYVFERPMPAADFEALLEKNPSGDWGRGFGTPGTKQSSKKNTEDHGA